MTAFTHTMSEKATLNTFFCFKIPRDAPTRFTDLGFNPSHNSVPIEGILILPGYSRIRQIMFIFKNIPRKNSQYCGAPYFSDNLTSEYHDLRAAFQSMRDTKPVLQPSQESTWLVGIGSTINTKNEMSHIELEINGFSVLINRF